MRSSRRRTVRRLQPLAIRCLTWSRRSARALTRSSLPERAAASGTQEAHTRLLRRAQFLSSRRPQPCGVGMRWPELRGYERPHSDLAGRAQAHPTGQRSSTRAMSSRLAPSARCHGAPSVVARGWAWAWPRRRPRASGETSASQGRSGPAAHTAAPGRGPSPVGKHCGCRSRPQRWPWSATSVPRSRKWATSSSTSRRQRFRRADTPRTATEGEPCPLDRRPTGRSATQADDNLAVREPADSSGEGSARRFVAAA